MSRLRIVEPHQLGPFQKCVVKICAQSMMAAAAPAARARSSGARWMAAAPVKDGTAGVVAWTCPSLIWVATGAGAGVVA